MLGIHAAKHPDKSAVINATSGEIVSYGELDRRSSQLADLFRSRGLRRGDHVALMMENRFEIFEITWACLRFGLYVTAINRFFTADEAAYVITDCDAKVFIISEHYREIARGLAGKIDSCPERFMTGTPLAGWENYADAVHGRSVAPPDEQWMGQIMLYSSGTTGRPKGIVRPLKDMKVDHGWFPQQQKMNLYGFGPDAIYLSPAPLYHSAPLNYSVSVHFYGGTVVMMEAFDAEASLRTIEKYQVTHSQWVPTMFVRLLRLPEEVRSRYDLSSHQVALHAAAPCPVEVKRQMIEWWGSRIKEYYGATENIGSTHISAEEWLERPGSVGRILSGIPHICDDEGNELPSGQPGLLYVEQPEIPFIYHKDEARTLQSRHPRHITWYTVGDVGYLDNAGYLFLTDRKAFMIVSGGVNIYPQAIEDALIMHPKVADVAVVGVPNPDFGEEVKAVVELAPGIERTEALKQELMALAREKVAKYMVPKSVDFVDQLPRLPTGKLYKQKVREAYWPTSDKPASLASRMS